MKNSTEPTKKEEFPKPSTKALEAAKKHGPMDRSWVQAIVDNLNRQTEEKKD